MYIYLPFTVKYYRLPLSRWSVDETTCREGWNSGKKKFTQAAIQRCSLFFFFPSHTHTSVPAIFLGTRITRNDGPRLSYLSSSVGLHHRWEPIPCPNKLYSPPVYTITIGPLSLETSSLPFRRFHFPWRNTWCSEGGGGGGGEGGGGGGGEGREEEENTRKISRRKRRTRYPEVGGDQRRSSRNNEGSERERERGESIEIMVPEGFYPTPFYLLRYTVVSCIRAREKEDREKEE